MPTNTLWAKKFEIRIHQKDKVMINNHWERSLTRLVRRKMKITMRYYTPTETAKINRIGNS